ncbi:MAG: hypothetical protein ACTSRK_20470 [Promethearchaeota archaeon]
MAPKNGAASNDAEMEFNNSSRIIDLLKQFNQVILQTVSGPNCVDPKVCHGDCCFVHLDVPRALVQHYIDSGCATINNFKRGITFAFEPVMDLATLKCPFFDPEINGCGLHFSGVKIPQCWVYPTGLDPDDINSTCKRAEGWTIVDPSRANAALKILSEYMELCKQEAAYEQRPDQITKRLNAMESTVFLTFKPSQLAGIQDGWDKWGGIVEEGWQLGLRTLCNKIKCSHSYFECSRVCDELNSILFQLIGDKVPDFIRAHGYKTQILFLDLFS